MSPAHTTPRYSYWRIVIETVFNPYLMRIHPHLAKHSHIDLHLELSNNRFAWTLGIPQEHFLAMISPLRTKAG